MCIMLKTIMVTINYFSCVQKIFPPFSYLKRLEKGEKLVEPGKTHFKVIMTILCTYLNATILHLYIK